MTNGKFIAKNGDFVDAPAREPSQRLPPEPDAVHIQQTGTFAKFLQFESKEESDKALKPLENRHVKEYRKKWKALDKRDIHQSYKEKVSFKKDINWTQIAEDLVELQGACKPAKSTGNVIAAKVSELTWQGHVQDYGFLQAWNDLVGKYVTASAGVSYRQSTYEPPKTGESSASRALQATVEDELEQDTTLPRTSARPSDANAVDNEGDTTMADKSSGDRSGNSMTGGTSADDPGTTDPGTTEASATKEAQGPVSRDLGELADAAITVEDGDERRCVFGWRSRGLGKQLYLTMTPADSKTAVIDIVNARLWQKSIQ